MLSHLVKWTTTKSVRFRISARPPGSKLTLWSHVTLSRVFNTLRPRQNGRHFADDIFKCMFLNENTLISISVSLTFVPEGRINNISAVVQIMAWRRLGDKPLSEPMMVSLLTHICVTRPHWVKQGRLFCQRSMNCYDGSTIPDMVWYLTE